MGLRVRVYRVKSLKWLYMGLCRERLSRGILGV